MDRDALARRLMTLFLAELEEHERTLERDLLALERASEAQRAELIESLFRAAHSLKGAARAVQAISIEGLCHHLEQSLSELRGQSAALAPERMQALLAQVDAVKAAAELLRKQQAVEVPPASAPVPKAAPAPNVVAPRAAAQATAASPAAGQASARPSTPTTPRATQAEDTRPARVDMQKLDTLLASSGDLVVAGSRIEERLAQFDMLREEAARIARGVATLCSAGDHTFTRAAYDLERKLDGLQTTLRIDARLMIGATRRVDDQVRRLRMVPIREACEGLDRSVRDLARTMNKEARLVVTGDQLEIDRELVQRLRDPLLHLVRNAVSHGIERREERLARGKAAEATISIAAQLRGSQVEVSIEDDGRGLDLDAIRARARSLGLPEAGDEDELAAYAFAPGLSTATTVSEIAGRGVGLDAVKRSVEALHGAVRVNSRAGQGACFTLRLPLTLSKLRCLFVRVSGINYAFPTAHVVRVVRLRESQLVQMGGVEFVHAEDELVPAVPLSPLLGLSNEGAALGEQAQAIVISSFGRSVALITSELVDEREAIVNKLPPRIASAHYVSGATLLPNGQIALVLHGAEIGQTALANLPRATPPLFAPTSVDKPKLLVADDSITTRALIKSILEEAGYDVTAARDGAEAFRMLSEQSFALVVSDVQMPNMDGFALTEAIRRSSSLARVPVILVTSLEAESDKLRGLEAGANAYLGKSAFDHRVLLQVVGSLL